MKKKTNIPENFEENLDKFAPKLSAAGKENPFEVPGDYFDSLPGIISSKIASTNEETSIAEKAALIFRPKFYISLAIGISVIILAIIMIKIPGMKTTDNSSLAYTGYESSAEMQYLDSLIDNGDIDDAAMMEALSDVDDTSKNIKAADNHETDIYGLNKSTVILTDSLSNIEITDDDIIQYLLDNDDADDIGDY